MIPFKSNMIVANKVLKAVQKEHDPKDWPKDRHVHIEAYSNGREQGYYITDNFNVGVAFSEYRSSDSIVVYVGSPHTFTMQGNVPDEETYENKSFFNPGEYEKAANFIIKQLRKWKPTADALHCLFGHTSAKRSRL